jgi:hypothetical protein
VPPTTDPWTAFLQWLETIIIPDWGGLISLLPILIIIGVIGPAVTLLFLYWAYVLITDRRGKVKVVDVEPALAELDAEGNYVFPVNTPYCPTHNLVYPPKARECNIDGEELRVRCPVDGTIRVAGQELCQTCGTRYQLGASVTPLVVSRRGRPPAGGAAVA